MPRIQESHPEPNERIIMPKFNPDAKQPEYQLIDGTYPFEIIGVEQSTSAKGDPERKVKLQFYSDLTFKQKIGAFEDMFWDNPDSDWKFSVLAKCVGLQVQPNQAFDIDDSWKGFRGIAECKPKANPKAKDPTKLWNRVSSYLTDQPAITPNKVEDPFAE